MSYSNFEGLLRSNTESEGVENAYDFLNIKII